MMVLIVQGKKILCLDSFGETNIPRLDNFEEKKTQHFLFGQFRNNTKHSECLNSLVKNTTRCVCIIQKTTQHSGFGQFREGKTISCLDSLGKTHNTTCLDSLGKTHNIPYMDSLEKETKHSVFGQFRKRNKTFHVWIVQEKKQNIPCLDSS